MGLFNYIRGTEKPERRRVEGNPGWRKVTAIKLDRDPYDDRDFLQLLYLERRRSERSSGPFCLILLDGSGITDIDTRKFCFRQVFEQLRGSIRETDIIGWYKQDCTLAIIFSNLTSDDAAVVNAVQAQVNGAVAAALPIELVKHVHMSVHLFPKNNNLGTGITDLTLYPDLPPQSPSRKAAQTLKRLIDVVGTLILISLFAPVMALIALVIKLNSKGPVIFRQVRVGHQGRLFSFWKFRSMYVGNDATIHKEYVTNFISNDQPANEGEAVYKIVDDPRVTPVGRFLRKTSLDELPQLWNVLRGDMSLVGPRPPVPYEFDCYALWHRRRVLEVKPGITGLWQVMGRSRISFNEMVRLDIRYVQQWSLWLDFKILLQTPRAVLMGGGAY